MGRHTQWVFVLLLLSVCGAVLLALNVSSADADSITAVVNGRSENPAAKTSGNADQSSGIQSTNAISTVIYFPFVGTAPLPCPAPGAPYGTVAVLSAPANPPAEINPDINLAMRGYTTTTGTLGLIDLPSTVDPSAPQLYRLFVNNRVSVFKAVYQVYDWDWTCNCRGAPIADPPVTLAGFQVGVGESICAPGSGYDIGRSPATGYSMMVLYASANRITLKYTRDDNVVSGYTLHVENINVDPDLLSLYQAMNAAGRSRLPALFAGQPIGRAISTELGVAIRDTGSFLDPRSRLDWWQGK